jgi:vacuolar-type H+-ATPase subunit I/STV1
MATVETTTEAPETDAEGTETTKAPTPETGGKGAPGKPPRAADATLPDDPDELRAAADRMQKALEKANKEAARTRIDRNRLEELEEEKRQAEESKLSEAEKVKRAVAESATRARTLEADNEALRRQLADLRIDHAVQAEAADAGFLYPGDVPRLIDRARVEIDEDSGKVAGAKDAVARLAKDRPGLLRAQAGAGSPQAMTTRRPGQGGGLTADQQQASIEMDMRKHIHYPI